MHKARRCKNLSTIYGEIYFKMKSQKEKDDLKKQEYYSLEYFLKKKIININNYSCISHLKK